MTKELDNSANMAIATLRENAVANEEIANRIDGALNAIYEVKRRIEKMQRKTPLDSKQWHRLETLDDLLHEALASLGE